MAHELLTTAEVAGLFRVTENTVYRWVQSGVLRSVSPPGAKVLRFRRIDIEALLAPSEPVQAEAAS